ncbi:Peroxidase 27 [Acorus calamus]|uniref:Peroxidase n=1 Tax=Acorus calamus TaxID=4465 RepID=A0AAV9C7U1_ACOCL|nr:Peroxidase 27 [Acorus calamus]
MASNTLFTLSTTLSLLLVLSTADAQDLKVGFYAKSCPNLEAIVFKTTARFIGVAPTLAAPLLRMHFHDCFIRGCEGSILLNTTNKNAPAEKDAPPNLSLRGYHVIDAVKAAVEKACPGVVSCADLLALVARDVVTQVGNNLIKGVLIVVFNHLQTKGPHWQVETGRRDGKVSIALETRNLPPPSANITLLKSMFGAVGLNAKDIVVLSGAHTIGNSHCSSFSNRIYNYSGRADFTDTDPKLDSEYVPRLRSKCRSPNDLTTIVEMDPGSFRTFDSDYYKLVSKRRGIFESDAALLSDPETKAYVARRINGPIEEFFRDFGESMVKMGRTGVLTGKNGEIRKQCRFINS